MDRPARSWWAIISTVVPLAGAVAIACLDIQWFFRVPASLLAALLQVRLFVLSHDHMHGAILKESRLARIVFGVSGFFALAPSSVWKNTHDEHHRTNSRRFGLDSVGSYPVLTVQAYREADPWTRFLYHIARHPLTILGGYFTVFLWGFCLRPLIRKPKGHLDAALVLGVHLALLGVLAVYRLDVAFYAILLPTFVASAFGSYLFYAQHNFPGVRLRADDDWDYVFAALKSSSFIPMNPVLSWFTANIGYHHVHHLNARIPFYRLPEAVAALPELQSAGVTRLSLSDIRRCLRLKLWEPGEDRFLTFAEARAWARNNPVTA